MKPLLSAEYISKSYSKNGQAFCVFKDINIELYPGQIVCLLGPSGSGKTTILQSLSGLEKPNDGRIVSNISLPGPELGYMMQTDRLLPWRTIQANVALGLELAGIQNEGQVEQLLTRVGLQDFTSHYPAQLSGGMKQRAAIARMLATNPKILLLDEPMSHLDVLARKFISQIIKDYVRQENAAALIVTHSVEEAAFLADRIIFITRSPAVLHHELTENLTLDTIMQSLLNVLHESEAL